MSIVRASSRKYLGSLRRRYLFLAAAVSLALLIGAVVTDWHTRDIANENTSSLTLRVHANEVLSVVRNALRIVDVTLSKILVTPLPEHENILRENINVANKEVAGLLNHLRASVPQLSNEVFILSENIKQLEARVSFLLGKRKDPTWVYPIIPFVNEKMLVSNNNFENSASIVLHSIEENDGKSYASTRFGQFDTLRDLWRVKVLNFRLLLIRFAGLGYVKKSPQETNIEDINEVIEEKLSELHEAMKKGELSFDEEHALETMQQASSEWYISWQAVKKFRSKKVWRNDTEFMDKNILPIQQKIYSNLSYIDNKLLSMSSQNVELVQQTTNVITGELWAFFILSMLFVIGIYWMIDRSILRPIENISKALSAEGLQKDYDLENQDSQEIYQLVSAFKTMKGQIHQRQEELQNQALHDALTGLPNRTLFNDRLGHAIEDAQRNKSNMAVLLLDLDRFKDVNDVLGHHVGDQLLEHVAKRLDKLVRGSDTVARFGGDEFAIVAPYTDKQNAIQFSEKIVTAINNVFRLEAQNIHVGVSIGIAIFPNDGEDATTLIRHSDVAMYEAKREGKGFSVYNESQDQGNAEHLLLVESLHNEFEQTQFLSLSYQPQIELSTGELVGVEALIRWKHPDLGVIAPEKIIQVAEHAGQIDKLTDWVICTALKECAKYKDKLRFSINLSTKNLRDEGLPLRIEKLINKYEVFPSSLTLEITESAVMSHPVKAREIMNELSEMGIKMSVDDYGTGFSSLGYLKMLPVSELKIDKTFVINMLDDENDEIIVRSTIELAHNLGLEVVAEGVENNEILSQLRKLKCDTAQGYYISRPMPNEALCLWIEEYTRKVATA